MAQDAAAPSPWAGRYLVRAVWGVLVVGALIGHVWLARLPFPLDATTAPPLQAAPGERLLLLLPGPAEPLIRYRGEAGATVNVRFERARLSLATLALLRSAGLDPPSEDTPLEWLGDAGDGARTFLSVSTLAPGAGLARIELFQLPEADRRLPYFELRARGTALQLAMAAADADPFAAQASTRRLTAAGQSWTLPAALPLDIQVADGHSLRMQVAIAAASGEDEPAGRFGFGFGAGEGREALMVRGAGVIAADGSLRLLACSAPPRGPYWRGAATMTAGDCDRGPATPALSLTRLAVTPDGLATALAGRAWVVRDQTAINPPLGTRLRNEAPLLAAVAGADLVLALGAGLPLYRALRRRQAARKAEIFISYRRDDSIADATLIAKGLAEQLGRDRVFIDLEDIRPGDRFLQRITDIIAGCRAMVVVIGPGWLDARRDNQRRLDDPKDVVRHEIVQAITHRLEIVPVLVRDAPLPRADALPADIAGLLEHSALQISMTRLQEDVARLAAALRPTVDGAEGDEV